MKFIFGEIWGFFSVSAAVITGNWIIGLACFLLGIICADLCKIDIKNS